MTPLELLFDETQKKEFSSVLSTLEDLFEFTCGIHHSNGTNQFANGAHGLDHDLSVAAFAHAIGRKYSPSLAVTAVASALIHSYDRHPRSDGPETYSEDDVRNWIATYLNMLSQEERQAVFEAVVAHDKPNKGKLTNAPTSGDVLADADKLANCMVVSTIRMGQFWNHKPVLQVGNLEGRTPGATYREINVVFDDVYSRFDWLDDDSWFVTKEAKGIAREVGEPLRRFVQDVQGQFKAIGLDTFPR